MTWSATRRLAPTGRWRQRMPALVAVALSLVPVAGVFTLSRIFFLRDLTFAFRGRFRFLRDTVFSGSFPTWDPYSANGQATTPDALNQLFHLPSLAIRLLLPDVPAFNLWVVLPIPIAALGMYLFLRRHLAAWPAAFGAIAFSASGPIVSTTNFPNLSWSVAAVPYVFAALDRLIERRDARAAALLALAVSGQALAGEPVTLAATLAILAGYSTLVDGRWRDVRLVGLIAAGSLAGLLLSAIQYVPLAMASRASMRGTMAASDFWSFHPLALFELVVPHFFGDYFHSELREMGWMVALNSGRDPFYYTMYVGVPVLLLAAVAALSGRSGTWFWAGVVLACAIASLGPHTPLYPALQTLVPPLKSFRFPVKYLSLASFALATLAGVALHALMVEEGDRVPRRAFQWAVIAGIAASVVAYLAIGWVLAAPTVPIRVSFRLATWAGVPSPTQGAEFLLYRARPLLTSLFLKIAASTFLLWVAASRRREAGVGLMVLCGFAVVDLLAANSSVNPTMPLATVPDPAWVAQVPAGMHERVYVGGRLEGYINVFDVDAPKYMRYRDGFSQQEQRVLNTVQLVYTPAALRLRESISYDLPLLWPREYARTIGRFKFGSRDDRLRYLARTGTRFAVIPTPPAPGAQPLATLEGLEQLRLYDFNPQAARAYVVPDALKGPNLEWQIDYMFEARYDPRRGVIVSEMPPAAAGRPGAPVPASATFVEDGLHRVVVRAGLPADGYLALLDTYDPDWRVDVDGTPAPLMRANGLFRAVHLVPGTHVVTFTYHPSMLYLGAGITAATAAALALWCALDVRRAKQGAVRADA